MNSSACRRYMWNTRAGKAAERYARRYDIPMEEMREWFRQTPREEWPALVEYLEREALR